MGRLSRQELEQIIAREMPGWQLAEPDRTSRPTPRVDEVAPDIEQIRRAHAANSRIKRVIVDPASGKVIGAQG